MSSTGPTTPFFSHLFETWSGVSDLVDHGPLHGGHRYVGAVSDGLLVTIRSTSRLLVAWLVEIGLRDQDQGLDRHQHL